MRKKAMDHIVAVTKNNKQELATHKVELSKLDDLADVLNAGFGAVEDTKEILDTAEEAIQKARDGIRFRVQDHLGEAEGYIDEITDALDKLGLPSPELDKLQNQYDELEREMENLKQRVEKI